MTTVNKRRAPSGAALTAAQQATVERWRKRNPRVKHRLGAKSYPASNVSIVCSGHGDYHTVTIDAEGYEVAFRQVRVNGPYDPPANTSSQPIGD